VSVTEEFGNSSRQGLVEVKVEVEKGLCRNLNLSLILSPPGVTFDRRFVVVHCPTVFSLYMFIPLIIMGAFFARDQCFLIGVKCPMSLSAHSPNYGNVSSNLPLPLFFKEGFSSLCQREVGRDFCCRIYEPEY
jgi:hypothetical protein